MGRAERGQVGGRAIGGALRAAAAGLALIAGAAACGPPCGERGGACAVEGGAYFALPPADWEGGPLPMAMLLHGYSSTPEGIFDKADLAEVLSERGYLFVAPEGIDRTWTLPGSPEAEREPDARDDMAFLRAVAADAAARWPLSARLLGGFSHGSSAANVLACGSPEGWDGLLSVSGTFWRPVPEACAGPLPVRHTHGRADQTWPESGRMFSETVGQGDIHDGLAAWAATNGCAEAPVQTAEGPTACTVWPGCDLRLCMHEGAHLWPEGELSRQLDWFEALAETEGPERGAPNPDGP